jgi:DNA topoisomerase-2
MAMPTCHTDVQVAEAEALRIDNKVRFILAVISGDIKISNRKKADIERDLDAMGFDRLGSKKKVCSAGLRSGIMLCTCGLVNSLP